ncbi:MAG: topoisomerase DNA-binding C4 zinc finger domain-containing protein, partial [bacterium]
EKCGKGKMVYRKGFYGAFLGCDNYPKCKTIKQIPKKE